MPRGVPKNGFRMTKKWQERQGIAPSIPVIRSVVTAPVVVTAPIVEDIPVIESKIRDNFSHLAKMVEALASGKTDTTSLFISGPPGLGKSHTVNSVLSALELTADINTKFIGGYVRPIEMYRTMYNYRFSNCVIVFDDSDYIFDNETSLNTLKHATDSRKVRVVEYMSGAVDKLVDEDGEDIPKSFEFEGRIIFLTNYNFFDLIDRQTKYSVHLSALISRAHYIDIGIHTPTEYFVRIRQVIEEDGMLDKKGVDKDKQKEILDFIHDNIGTMRDRSVRVVGKLVDFMAVEGDNWKSTALARLTRAS